MNMFNYLWLCMSMYDYVWLCITMDGFVWLCMTMCDYLWLCWTMYAYVGYVWPWLSMTKYDYVWLCKTMFPNVIIHFKKPPLCIPLFTLFTFVQMTNLYTNFVLVEFTWADCLKQCPFLRVSESVCSYKKNIILNGQYPSILFATFLFHVELVHFMKLRNYLTGGH